MFPFWVCVVQTNIASSVSMERTENRNEHVIDMTSTRGPSSSSSTQDRLQNGSDTRRTEEQPSTSVRPSALQPAFTIANGSISSNSSSVRRGNGNGNGNGHGRRRSPLNSGLWISVELVITVSQIIASAVVLSLFRDEKPHAPLREWVLGYASGCVATLPLLYWRYHHRNQTSEQDPSQPRQISSPESNVTARTNSYSLSSGTRTMEDEDHRTTTASGSVRGGTILNARVKVLMEYLKMTLDCFFAVWFVVGNVWIFGGHSSSTEAPNLYRLTSNGKELWLIWLSFCRSNQYGFYNLQIVYSFSRL